MCSSDLLRAAECLAQNLFISPPTISQHAATAAFDHLAVFDRLVKGYGRNRDLLVAGLADLGIDKVAPPDGAFYVYADVSHLGLDAADLCRRMLAETGVAIAPGWDFDPATGGRFVRFSYCCAEPAIHAALARLKAWLPSLG